MTYPVTFKLHCIFQYGKLNSIRKTAKLVKCPKSTIHSWLIEAKHYNTLIKKKKPRKCKFITNKIKEFIEDCINRLNVWINLG